MSGITGSDSASTPLRTVYAIRHGQKEFGSDNPPLTERGHEQVVVATKKHLVGINFDRVYCGTHIRHFESSAIAKNKLGLSCSILETPLLSLTNKMNDAASECTLKCRNHPTGKSIGFRVDTWIETDTVLMDNCFQQFQDFLKQIPTTLKAVLAISSSPIIESATSDPEKTWLLGECGIIKYIIDDNGLIKSSEIIFEGFFEKPRLFI